MFAIFFRRDAHIFFEHLGKVRAVIEAEPKFNLLNRQRRFDQKTLPFANPALHHVLNRRQARFLFEVVRQVRLTDKKLFADFFQRQIFGVVFVQVVQNFINQSLAFELVGICGALKNFSLQQKINSLRQISLFFMLFICM